MKKKSLVYIRHPIKIYYEMIQSNRARKTRKIEKTMTAGAVLASGGFGCVFQPSLKCDNSTRKKRADKDISKLMLKKYAKAEYKEINRFKKLLKAIPNYSDYFLLDGFSLCKPDQLDKEDLRDFNKKCNALKKKGIKESNINSNLNKLMSINMPYAGIDVGDYVEKEEAKFAKMRLLNKKLIDLLKHGILPMNKNHVYHCDIKDSNVLVDEDVKHTRLIDWGLSTTFNPNTDTKIPKNARKRPFQFNTPFSTILFQDTFAKLYATFLKKNPDPNYITVRSFVINYVLFVIEKRGPGHLRNINSIMKQFFTDSLMNVEDKFKEDIIEFEYTFYFIFEYLAKILFKYTRNNKFDDFAYFKEVFVKNVDVWGFVMVYMPIKDYLVDNFRTISKTDEEIIAVIKSVYLMMVEASCDPVDVDQVITKLEKLDTLFSKKEQGRTNQATHSLVESSSITSSNTKLYKSKQSKVKQTTKSNKSKPQSKQSKQSKQSNKTRKVSSSAKSKSTLTTFLKFLSTSKNKL